MLVFVSSALAALGYWGMFNVVHVGILGNEDPFYEDFQIKSGETALTSQQRLHAVIAGARGVRYPKWGPSRWGRRCIGDASATRRDASATRHETPTPSTLAP